MAGILALLTIITNWEGVGPLIKSPLFAPFAEDGCGWALRWRGDGGGVRWLAFRDKLVDAGSLPALLLWLRADLSRSKVLFLFRFNDELRLLDELCNYGQDID